jgi:gliding motility-associated-like protein
LSGYNWSVVFGNASLSCTNCPNPIVTVNGSGPINLIVTANTTNENFCGAEGFYQLQPGDQPQVSGPSFLACAGGTVIVNAGNPEYTDVEWFNVSGDLDLSCNVCDNPTVTVNSTGLLGFYAEVDDPDICRVSGTVAISIYPGDVSNLLVMPDPNANEIPQGSEVSVLLAATPTPASITWNVNGSEVTTTETTITFNAENEVNFIQATFINSLGCVQIDTISFSTVPPSYQIPNAFTPNNDQLNDKFNIILNGNITIEKFMVFNRWGQKVYDAEEGSPEGWDGQFKSEPAASDTYVYSATLRYPDGRTEEAKGDVILLR